MQRRAVVLVLLAASCAAPSRQDEGPDDTGTLEQALLACPGAATVQGIDVSGYQPNTNWTQVAGAGKKFAIIKATEATGYVNPYFARDWAQSKAAGLIRGAYHFFRPSYDGVAQADHFVDTMGALGAGDLPAMLDLEVTDGVADATLVARMNAFLARVEARTGKKPLIYVGFYFWRDTIGNPQGYKPYPLVIAAYVSPCPQVPDQWGTFTMWQYSSSGQVPGVSTNVDLDVFNGSLADLENLAGLGGTKGVDSVTLANGTSGYALLGNGTLKPFGGAPALATGLALPSGLGRSVALRADGKSGYVLDGYGALHPFGGAPAATGGPSWTYDIARSVVLRADGKSGYVLDGAGAIHPFSGAPTVTGGPSWPGQDLARDLVLRSDGLSGYVLDAWGAVHPFGGALNVAGAAGYTTGQDVARALVLGFDEASGYVLQKNGAVFPFGGAPAVPNRPTWAGDVARGFSLNPDGVSGLAVDADGNVGAFSADRVRDLSLNPAGKGYVLLASGALKPVGGAPAVTNGPSWPGLDIARRVVVRADGASGWVLDSAGAIHPFGAAPTTTGGAYWAGQDLARGLVMNAEGNSGYLLDAWGGLHGVSGAGALAPAPYWQGKDFARDFVLRADGVSGYTLDAEGGLDPVGGAPAVTGLPKSPGQDVARRVVLLPDGVSGWVLDASGAVHAFGDAVPVQTTLTWPKWKVAFGLARDANGLRLRMLDAYGRLQSLPLAAQAMPAELPVATLEPTAVDENGVPVDPALRTPGVGAGNDPNAVAGSSCAAVPGLAPGLLLLGLLRAARRRRR